MLFSIYHVLYCATLQETCKKCFEALDTSAPCRITSCAAHNFKPTSKSVIYEGTVFGNVFFGYDERRKLVNDLAKQVPGFVESGVIRPMDVENIGGLASIKDGLARMAAGNYSNVKLVASW